MHRLSENYYEHVSLSYARAEGQRALTRLNWSENRSDTCELLVEVTRISRAGDLGEEGRRNTLMVNVIPVNIPEEGVGHDFLGISWSGSQS